MRKCDEGRQQGESSGEKKNNEVRGGRGGGEGDDADMRRGTDLGEIFFLPSLPPSLPSSFIHSFNLVSTRCRVTDDMDGRAGGRQPGQRQPWGNEKVAGVAPITC